MSRLDEIQERVTNATPGPWFLDVDGDRGVYTEARASDTSRDIASAFEREDEVFIAHAREDIPKLLDLIRAARDLHNADGTRWVGYPRFSRVAMPSCTHCRHLAPCPTVRALSEAAA